MCGCVGGWEAPDSVIAEAKSSSEISVLWSGLSNCRLVNGHIVRYRVKFTACGRTESRDQDLGDGGDWRSGGEIFLTGLTPLTNYSIAVAAVNENGDIGVYSNPVTKQTPEQEDAIPEGAPQENTTVVIQQTHSEATSSLLSLELQLV